MEINGIQALFALAGGFTTFGGAWLTFRKIAKDARRTKQAYEASILQHAKEEIKQLRIEMDSKLEVVRRDLAALELTLEKEIDFVKQTHTTEIKSLGEKIESLRDDLRSQHANLVTLVSKLVDRA